MNDCTRLGASFVDIADLMRIDTKRWERFAAALKQWAEEARLYIASIEERTDITREEIERDMPRIWMDEEDGG